MKTFFARGATVECIDDRFDLKQRHWSKNLPVRGCRYTVRDAIHGYRGLGLRLIEIINPEIPVVGIGLMEPLFLASRFRFIDSDVSSTSDRDAEAQS